MTTSKPYPPLIIPLKNAEDGGPAEIVIHLEQEIQTDDAFATLVQILRNEAPPIRIFLHILAHFLRHGMYERCEKIIALTKAKSFREFYEKNDANVFPLLRNAQAVVELHHARRLKAKKEPRLSVPSTFAEASAASEDTEIKRRLLEATKLVSDTPLDGNVSDSTRATLAITRGELALELNNFRDALAEFDAALRFSGGSLRANLGRAHALMNLPSVPNRYRDAKDCYHKVLLMYPDASPVQVRVNLGLAYYALGEESRAQECLERALELDPRCYEAQAALGVIELGLASEADRAVGATTDDILQNQLRAKDLSASALQRFNDAYEGNNNFPLVLIHLANHFFSKKDSTKAEMHARTAHNMTKSDEIRAEALYILARILHERGEAKAGEYYKQAISVNKDFILPYFGDAQINFGLGDYEKALSSISIVSESPEGRDDEDSAMLMAALMAKKGQNEHALSLVRKVTDKNPHYAEAWILQASLEQSHYRTSQVAAEDAIRCYEKAQAALRLRNTDVPLPLINNVGVLKFRLGQFQGAAQAFAQVLGGAKVDAIECSTQNVTALYNYARALEALGSTPLAERAYDKIAKALPEYSDATLRLAAMAKARGHFSRAEELLKQMLGKHVDHVDAWLLYGNLLGEKKAFKVANDVYTKVKKLHAEEAPPDKDGKRVGPYHHDEYMRLCEANARLNQAHVAKPEDKDRLVNEAWGLYRGVLERSNMNIYAAVGVGACNAMRGNYETARLIFDKVREVSESSASCWINLAHTLMYEQSYSQAAALYEQCSKRFFEGKDYEVFFYMAHAHYYAGQLKESKAALLSALKLQPSEELLWSALATLEEAEAAAVLNVDVGSRSLAQVEGVVKTLQQAMDVYEWLAAKAEVGSSKAQVKPSKSAPKREPLLPHRPRTPAGAPPAGQTWSALLQARARVAARELVGREPDEADVALAREAERSLQTRAEEDRATAAAEGHRILAERAAHRRNAQCAKVAALALKRLGNVKAALAQSASVASLQARTERRNEQERRKQQEAREIAAAKSLEEQKSREQGREEELRLLREKAERLAEENKTLVTKLQATRRSTRQRKKSRKVLESAKLAESDSEEEESAAEQEEPEEESEEEPEAEELDDDEVEDEVKKAVVLKIRDLVYAAEDPRLLTVKLVRAALAPECKDVAKDFIQEKLAMIVERATLTQLVRKIVEENPNLGFKETLGILAKHEDVIGLYKAHARFIQDQVVIARGGSVPERKRKIKVTQDDEEDEMEMEEKGGEEAGGGGDKKRSRVVEDDE